MTEPVSAFEASAELDARGLYCPEPIMLLHNRVTQLQGDAEIRLVATDPSTQRDVPRFCRHLGHELLDVVVEGGPATGDQTFSYKIRVRQIQG